jgi:LacI family transcriptional regulator
VESSGATQMSGKKITIIDVARLANVSRTTVSRVINHKSDVDPATRERVMRVIEETGFVPDVAASGLAGGRNRLIGMFVPSFTWSNIPDIIRGIAMAINSTAYEMILYSYNDEDQSRDRRDAINRILATNLTSGILAIYPGHASEQIAQIYHQGRPIVVIDDQREHQIPWITIDDVTGAQLAVQHLIALGHRRIAHIKGPEDYLATHHRVEGYRRALAEAGISYDPELVLPGDFMPPSGHEGMLRLLALPPEQRPTAIFTSADQAAYGVLAAAEEKGISIPDEMALVGFDDDPLSTHLHPPLTTVHQPSYEMGKQAIELLLSMIATEEAKHSGFVPARNDVSIPHIVLPTHLVVRVSCGIGTKMAVHQKTINHQ